MASENRSTRGIGRIPCSTYRLQMHGAFGARDVAALLPYLDTLGISDCYLSPILASAPGSTHGYDTCDYARLDPELGSETEHRQLGALLGERNMGLLLDFVPNHMGAAVGNPWWRDVLENGRSSPFAAFFDIDWSPVKAELKDKLLLPILGDQYGAVLERGELRLRVGDAGTLLLSYFDTNLPIDPRSYSIVLERCLGGLRDELGEEDGSLAEYLSVITAFRHLPAHTECAAERVAERQREKEVARRRLGALLAASTVIRAHVERGIDAINGSVGAGESFDALHALLEAQPYRLSYWRTAAHEINYRRFFDINELAGLRMEDPAVFAATHALLLDLIAAGRVTGLRLDHVDGLFDPLAYLRTLQAAIRERLAPATENAAGADFYVVVEKILSDGERLRVEWPVAGTTGYDFLSELNGLFVNPAHQRDLTGVYRRFTGSRDAYANVLYSSKKLIMDGAMASELNVLAHALNRLSELDRRSRDFTLNSLRETLREVVACFSIYRTYVSARPSEEIDRAAIESAVRQARRRNPTLDPSLFEFVRAALLPEARQVPRAERDARLAFAMKFQQYTGPVEAKGREDTSFYRYNLLLSLNDVGGDPSRFGCAPEAFHAANQIRHEHWPHGLLATSTHDTKRSEDVRARLNVLSELPREWGQHLSRWARINASQRVDSGGAPAPDRNDEYAFYQLLLGAWPCSTGADDELATRLTACMTKAAREAKVHTSWLHPREEYETALAGFIRSVLRGAAAARFLPAFLPFQRRVAALGMVNSLAQVVLKALSPGVPDFYQGTEVWDFSLVDPDNRRAVDYAARQGRLAEMERLLATPAALSGERARAVEVMLEEWPDGRIKLLVTTTLLRLRRRLRGLFATGRYLPLRVEGVAAEHVVALARCDESGVVIGVVPRLLAGLVAADAAAPWRSVDWGDTRVALSSEIGAPFYDAPLSGERVTAQHSPAGDSLSLSALLATCPVAVLVHQRSER